jgi:hypothetical protein
MQIGQCLQIGPREYTVRLKQSTLDIRLFWEHFYQKFRNLILSDTSLNYVNETNVFGFLSCFLDLADKKIIFGARPFTVHLHNSLSFHFMYV